MWLWGMIGKHIVLTFTSVSRQTKKLCIAIWCQLLYKVEIQLKGTEEDMVEKAK